MLKELSERVDNLEAKYKEKLLNRGVNFHLLTAFYDFINKACGSGEAAINREIIHIYNTQIIYLTVNGAKN